MARGPDGKGATSGFSLADQMFNAQTIEGLADEYAVLSGFDPEQFQREAVDGLKGRGLLERLDWMADCLETQLPTDFADMAQALEQAMPPALDPTKTDDDFGHFIHALPGILAVRHGLEHHRDRALDLLHAATQRFSMEFYIRPFLNRWPDETLARLHVWAEDPNYHVRRLVSEGTRPRLPWARNITLDPAIPLQFLDKLHADPTRYVTRSVANHMNDLSKVLPEQTLAYLNDWQDRQQQETSELNWMSRHALRTAVKRGEIDALAFLGYRQGAVSADLVLDQPSVAIGDKLTLSATLGSDSDLKVMVDYRLRFHRPNGPVEKVFKLKSADIKGAGSVTVSKAHRFKGDATTFQLYPGPHAVILQVNGQDVAEAHFDLLPSDA